MNDIVQHVPDAAAGLALEAARFISTGPQILMWRAEAQGIVVPSAFNSRAGFEAACAVSAQRGWPVHLRPTGGGAVPQGPGIDNLALAFDAPPGFTIQDAYRLLTDIIKAGLGPHGEALAVGDTPASFCDGAWNLSAEGRKLVGTAQRWRPAKGRRPRVLAHALILTRQTFAPGADAIDALHRDLKLAPVSADAHTSLEAAFDRADLPADTLHSAADAALKALAERQEG